MAQLAIDAAEAGDFSICEKLHLMLKQPYTATSQNLRANGIKSDPNGHKKSRLAAQCYLALVNHSSKHAFICTPTKHITCRR